MIPPSPRLSLVVPTFKAPQRLRALLRSVASQLEHAQRKIQREIDQEDEDYRAISEGSNVSVQELREKAPNDWYITASEAKAMGLIAEVV